MSQYVICPKCKRGIAVYKNSNVIRTHTRRIKKNKKLFGHAANIVKRDCYG